jgi:lysozyme
MVTSEEGASLIKKFEGCKLEAYQCAAGVWTIGYGHTKEVSEGDVISQFEAEDLLTYDLQEFEGYVLDYVSVPLKQNEFDALVSWTFNLGSGNLRSSTLLKKLNDHKYKEVPTEIRRWNKAAGKVLDGLVRRREAESLLFQGKEWHNI